MNVLQAQETILTGREENTWTVLPSCEFTLEMRVKSIENAVLVCTWLTNLVLLLNYYYLFNIHERLQTILGIVPTYRWNVVYPLLALRVKQASHIHDFFYTHQLQRAS